MKLGFGWEYQSDVCKVFVVLSKKKKNERIGKIYSSKTNSWKTVEHGSIDLYSEVGKVVGGRIYWHGRDGYIEAFNLKSEVFARIKFPFKQVFDNHHILISNRGLDGELWVVQDDCDKAIKKFWGMKKNGEESLVEVSSGPIPGPTQSTYQVLESAKREVDYSSRRNIVDCYQDCFYIDSLVTPVSDKNNA